MVCFSARVRVYKALLGLDFFDGWWAGFCGWGRRVCVAAAAFASKPAPTFGLGCAKRWVLCRKNDFLRRVRSGVVLTNEVVIR